jgi:hypothetical protein
MSIQRSSETSRLLSWRLCHRCDSAVTQPANPATDFTLTRNGCESVGGLPAKAT